MGTQNCLWGFPENDDVNFLTAGQLLRVDIWIVEKYVLRNDKFCEYSNCAEVNSELDYGMQFILRLDNY